MALSVGEKLKQARTERGQSLDQAAQVTRIRRHYLEALERDDRDSLPSAVQGRGFLRLYASFLDLPVEALVAQWEGRPYEVTPPDQPAEPVVMVSDDQPPHATEPVPAETLAEAPLQSSEITSGVDEERDEPALPPMPSPIGSQAIFKEIGDALRRQREALSLSLADMERYTRLRQHYLRAMESGRLDELPSMVQGRGMLSNYAAFLNLDSENLLLRYAEGLQMRRLERMADQKTSPLGGARSTKGARQASTARRLLTPDLLFGGGLILVLLIFVIWTAARISSIRSGEAQPTLPSVGEALLVTPSATIDQTAASQPAGENTPEGAPTSEVLASSPNLEATATLAPINTDPLQVYVVARQRAFLRVDADGQIKFNGRVVPGNAYAFSGTEIIELTTGNAAALQIFFNQSDLGRLGTSGQVLRMTFTQTGVVTPTPLPTPTASATPEITVTPGPSPTVVTPTVTPLIP